MKLFKKLNSHGFSHGMMLLFFMVIFGIGGVAYLVATNANAQWKDVARADSKVLASGSGSDSCYHNPKYNGKLCSSSNYKAKIEAHKGSSSIRATNVSAVFYNQSPGTYRVCYSASNTPHATYSASVTDLPGSSIPSKTTSHSNDNYYIICTPDFKLDAQHKTVKTYVSDNTGKGQMHVRHAVLKKLITTSNTPASNQPKPQGDGTPGTAPCEQRTFRKGDKDGCVNLIQDLLNSKGYGLSVDGDFGPKTDSAVREFQGKVGLTVDGVVGPNTWSKLKKSGGEKNASNPAPSQPSSPPTSGSKQACRNLSYSTSSNNGTCVARLHDILNRGHNRPISESGYGSQTIQAVKDVQNYWANNGYPEIGSSGGADGKAGPNTAKAICQDKNPSWWGNGQFAYCSTADQ